MISIHRANITLVLKFDSKYSYIILTIFNVIASAIHTIDLLKFTLFIYSRLLAPLLLLKLLSY